MSGKKGDKIHIPKPTRGDANAKAADTAVTIIANTESELTVTLTVTLSTHVSSKTSLKYRLSTASVSSTLKTLDTLWLSKLTPTCTLLVLVSVTAVTLCISGSVAPTDYQHTGCFFNDGGTTTQYTDDTIVAADVFTDAFFRDMIQKLDDNNVPMDGSRTCHSSFCP